MFSNYSTITFTRGNKNLFIPFLSICNQTVKPKRSILVIDGRWNNWIDYKELGFIFSMYKIQFDVYISNENSFAKMKNKYYNLIETEEVLYVEDDCFIPYNYAEILLNHFNNGSKLGAIGGCQLLTNNFIDIDEPPVFQKIDLPKEEIYQRLIVKNGKLEYGSMKHQVYAYNQFKLIPCHALIHTYMLNVDCLKEVNGWDEEAPENGSLIFEEMDVTFRIYLKGYNVKVDTSLIMWHLRNQNPYKLGDSHINVYDKAIEDRKIYFGMKFSNVDFMKGLK